MKALTTFTLLFLSFFVPCDKAGAQSYTRSSFDEVRAEFRTPPRATSVNCWWWWMNGHIDKETVTKDLEAMRAKNFEGAMIFDAGPDSDFPAGPEEPSGPLYGSGEWIELFVHALNEAERLDLKIGLNIQSGWNLGGPRVTPEYAAKKITISETRLDAASGSVHKLEKPQTHRNYYRDLWVLAFPAKKENIIETGIHELDYKSLSQEIGRSAPDCSWMFRNEPRDGIDARKTGPSMIVEEGGILDLTPHTAADGTLTWKVPAGEWVVLRIGYTNTHATVSTSSAGWTGPVLDYMSVEAFDFYWKDTAEPILTAAGRHAGTTLNYLETDSWECDGMTWTKGFEDEFKAYCGYDIKNLLPIFAGYVVNDMDYSHDFLNDFRKTLGHLVSKNHYARFAGRAHEYGIGIMPESAGPHAGPLDGIKNYGNSDIIMSEFWSDSPHRATPDNRYFIKQASSAAHIYGKRIIAAESFTRLGPHWNDILWAQHKPAFDHEVCSGLNKVYFHTFTASPDGEGLPGLEYFAGSHINRHITWWKYADAFIGYLHRVQNVVQNGRFVADVLYYYGDHVPNIYPLKDRDLAGAMPGFDYDVTGEDVLLRSSVKHGNVVVPSGLEYRVLVLPEVKTLSLAVLRKVESLLLEGATVIGTKPALLASLVGGEDAQAEFRATTDRIWGERPAGTDSKRYGRGNIVWGVGARDYLLAVGVSQDLNIAGYEKGEVSEYDYIHYVIDGRDVYYLCNLTPENKEIVCEFRVKGRRPEIWNPVTGEMAPAGAFTQNQKTTSLPLSLGPNGSLFVVFDEKISAGVNGEAVSNRTVYSELQALDGDWVVNFDPEWGGPESIVFEELIDWTRHPDEGIRYYSGSAVYNKSFKPDFKPQKGERYFLELGSVKDIGIASVRLNGVELGVVWTPPFRVDIGDALQPGRNTLEITVVNSWHNRVLADQLLAPAKPFTRTNVKLDVRRFAPTAMKGKKKELPADLEPSGLLGPVVILKSAHDVPD